MKIKKATFDSFTKARANSASIRVTIPYFSAPVSCGFPSPADDFMETPISLDRSLIKNPNATFFVRAKGDSMIGLGIHDGDLLVIDRSIKAKVNAVVLAVVEGEFTVKQLKKKEDSYLLEAANPHYPNIKISQEYGCEIWGVITHVIHAF